MRVGLGGVGLLLLVFVLYPVWLPWVLRPLLRSQGATFGAYERRGFVSFALRDLAVHRPGIDLTASRVVPRFDASQRQFAVIAESWQLKLTPVAPDSRRQKPSITGPYLAFQNTERMLPALRQWLGQLIATDGEIVIHERHWLVPRLEWKGGLFSAETRAPATNLVFSIVADLTNSAPHRVSITLEPIDLTIDATVAQSADDWTISGVTRWESNRGDFKVRFVPNLPWPETASFRADHVQIPAAALKLEGFGVLTGAVDIAWDAAAAAANSPPAFSINLHGFANPTTTNLPPVEVNIAAAGDPDRVSIRTFTITTPWLVAGIDKPFEIHRTVKLLTESVPFSARFDFNRFPWGNYAGVLYGFVTAEPTDGFYPRITFTLKGDGLRISQLTAEDVTVGGELIWPLLRFNANAALKLTAESSQPSAEPNVGRWRLRDGQLDASGEFDLGTRRLPTIAASWRAGDSVIVARGSGDLTAASRHLHLVELTLSRGERKLYELAQPIAINLTTNALGLTDFDWRGDRRFLTANAVIDWPHRGTITLKAGGIRLAPFSDLVTVPATDMQLDSLVLDAQWDRGPARFRLDADVSVTPRTNTQFFVNARIEGDQQNLRLDSLNVSSVAGVIVQAHGTVPLTLAFDRWPDAIQVRDDKPIQLEAVTTRNEAFWESLSDLTGIRLIEPELSLQVSGTPANPRGAVRLRAATVDLPLPQSRFRIPKLDQLQVDVVLDEQRATLREFSMKVEDQPVRVTGSLPMGRKFWTRLLREKQWPDWHDADVHLRIDDANVAPFTHYLPRILSPQGKLSVDLALRPGARLDGVLTITNAATRPLLPLGPIRNLKARVLFADRVATIENFSGDLGGQAVVVNGRFELSANRDAAFELTLKGENVPLVRQPGLVLRSDLDVRLRQPFGEVATLSGAAVLRNSLFLQDLALLAPGRLAAPEQRPPYFRVKEKLLADWKVDLKITGDRFLKVRNPVFRGTVSVNLNLVQTLGDPIALGDARINSGLVRFPFADLTVDHGLVTLSRDNPYEAKLYITASAEAFGYSVKMEVRGSGDDPHLTFTSNPPLTSEEVLLMLTAGELPRKEYTFTGQQRASQLALYLGRDLLTKLGADRATADRLTIRTGENISEEGNLTYSLEFKLTERVSAVGEYDRFNAFNAGIKLKLYSK